MEKDICSSWLVIYINLYNINLYKSPKEPKNQDKMALQNGWFARYFSRFPFFMGALKDVKIDILTQYFPEK
jgi:hypothetical protein